MVKLAVYILVALLVGAVVGQFRLIPSPKQAAREPDFAPGVGQRDTLFVVAHGLGGVDSVRDVSVALCGHGDVLTFRYRPLSNAAPEDVVLALRSQIDTRFREGSYSNVVLVGHSMGTLLLRRALVDASETSDTWASAVSRLVLLAGLNRGWDISGHRPVDMKSTTWFSIWIGSWFGRFVGMGNLALKMEAGTTFVANLRLDWIEHMNKKSSKPIEVIQLLGDIDDLVSEEDNIDLAQVQSDNFAWLRVRGTGHTDIATFNDTKLHGTLKIGDYRRDKFLLAAVGTIAEIQEENVVQSILPNEKITHVVFVIHGIRDYGKWASAVEESLRDEFKRVTKTKRGGGSAPALAIESSRYGYFGMGPFLFQPNRLKYVKWLMEEYTDVRAKYPNAEHIHFFGHSNGTYLLARALEDYESLRINRAVFAGSIVRQEYRWKKIFHRRQVQQVLNLQATEDWVVATFPRFFELGWMRWMNNDIGSAGFNGFKDIPDEVNNVAYVAGAHSAFQAHIPEIARFLIHGDSAGATVEPNADNAHPLWMLMSAGFNVILIALIGVALVFVGWRVYESSGVAAWPLTLAYLGLVLTLLRHA